MRNLKKALALVIAMTMVLSTVAFAATFSDVASDSAYAEAIELGVALGFFTGYEDGTFKPEGDVTRAEFAAIVVRALGQATQADGAKGTTKFTDVAADSWAAGYINIASNMKIVNGYGDGTFGPEDKVTYEQAVKMLVVALGYEPAVGSAGYPVGYLTIAQQNGMTASVKGTNGVALNRGQVAQLVANSLDVPLMEQTGFGTYIDYVIQDGSGDTYRKTIMSEKLGVVKLRVMVDSSYEISSVKKSGKVKVIVNSPYNSKYADEDYDSDTVFAKNSVHDVDAGKTNLKGLVGSQAVIYIAYDENSDDDPLALYAKKYVSSADQLIISSDDIDETTLADGVLTVDYYETDTASRTTDFTISNNAAVFVNGYKVNSTVEAILANFYGTATFSLEDSTSEEDYDTVFINDYKNLVVDEVNTSIGKVSGKTGDITSIIFKESNTDYSSKLVDKDGKELDWSILKENDVLSVQKVIGTSRTINVCTLVQDVVTGTVTEISGDMSDADDAEFTINGKSYKVDGRVTAPNDLSLEDEGSFYLDIMGRIVYVDTTSTVNANYAYILDADESGSIDKTTQVKMFTYAGEVVTLDTASKVRVSYYNGTKYVTESVDAEDLLTTAEYKLTRNKFVTFGLNSAGRISKIAFPDTNLEGQSDVKNFALYRSGTANFDVDKARFSIDGSTVYVTDKTIIMQAPYVNGTDADPVYDEDKYELFTLSALVDDYEGWLNVTAYDVNEDKEANVIVIGEKVDLTSSANGVAMVIKISQAKNSDGDTIDKAVVLQNGNKNDLKPIDLLADEDTSLENLKNADVIVPDVNGRGEVTGYNLVAKVVGSSVVPNMDYIDEVNNKVNGKVKFTIDKVTGRKANKVILENNSDVLIPADANVYVYEESGSKPETKVYAPDGRYDVFSVDKDGTKYYDEDSKEIAPVYVLVREYDDEVADVIFYIFKK